MRRLGRLIGWLLLAWTEFIRIFTIDLWNSGLKLALLNYGWNTRDAAVWFWTGKRETYTAY